VVPLFSLESESQDIWMLLSDNQEDPWGAPGASKCL
jgi:hypothetical protein